MNTLHRKVLAESDFQTLKIMISTWKTTNVTEHKKIFNGENLKAIFYRYLFKTEKELAIALNVFRQ